MTAYVFIPGYGNSLGDHWQQEWFKKLLNSYWVEQKSWEEPECNDWIVGLNDCVKKINQPIMFVCHSLGCLTLAGWAQQYNASVLGALLVAVPDPLHSNFPKAISGYAESTIKKLPFRSKMVVSTNDTYCTQQRSTYFANQWGSELTIIGNKGHINADSGFGEWSDGLAELQNWEKLL